jgi:hypothetical protein
MELERSPWGQELERMLCGRVDWDHLAVAATCMRLADKALGAAAASWALMAFATAGVLGGRCAQSIWNGQSAMGFLEGCWMLALLWVARSGGLGLERSTERLGSRKGAKLALAFALGAWASFEGSEPWIVVLATVTMLGGVALSLALMIDARPVMGSAARCWALLRENCPELGGLDLELGPGMSIAWQDGPRDSLERQLELWMIKERFTPQEPEGLWPKGAPWKFTRWGMEKGWIKSPTRWIFQMSEQELEKAGRRWMPLEMKAAKERCELAAALSQGPLERKAGTKGAARL